MKNVISLVCLLVVSFVFASTVCAVEPAPCAPCATCAGKTCPCVQHPLLTAVVEKAECRRECRKECRCAECCKACSPAACAPP